MLDFLSRELGVEQIRLESDAHEALVGGEQAILRLRVVADASDRPVPGARVTVKLISTHERPTGGWRRRWRFPPWPTGAPPSSARPRPAATTPS